MSGTISISLRRAGLLVLLAVAARGEAEPRAPEPLSFFAAAEPSEVELGRPFSLRVEVRHPARERYRLPADLDLGPAMIRSVEETREEGEEATETVFFLEALIFDALGEVELPELLLSVEDEEGALEPLRIPGAAIRIRETGGGVELAPPPAPLSIRVFAWERLALVAGGLALFLGLVFFLRRRRARIPEDEGPRRTPAEEVERQLAILRAQALWEKGETRRHYFRLSEILRVYLRDTEGVPAVEMTSDELILALRRHPIPGLSRDEIEAWIRRGDLARFAKGEVGAEQALADLEALGEMVAAVEEAKAPAASEGEA